MKEIKFKKLRSDATIPTRHNPTDSGFDLYAVEPRTLGPHDPVMLLTGIACAIPRGYEGQIRPRSSTSRAGILISLGTIDEGFRGELAVMATNLNQHVRYVNAGDRIAQFVIVPVLRPVAVEVQEFEDNTDRGEHGWGSSGR